jgi:hypothetical protein
MGIEEQFMNQGLWGIGIAFQSWLLKCVLNNLDVTTIKEKLILEESLQKGAKLNIISPKTVLFLTS